MVLPRMYPLFRLQLASKFCQFCNIAKKLGFLKEIFFDKVDSFLPSLGHIEKNFVILTADHLSTHSVHLLTQRKKVTKFYYVFFLCFYVCLSRCTDSSNNLLLFCKFISKLSLFRPYGIRKLLVITSRRV